MSEKANDASAKKSRQVDDYFASWKKVYESNEDLWTKLWENVLTSESYADLMGLTNKQTMFFLDILKKNTSNFLYYSNIPSRDDLANTTKQVIAVEEKVDDLVFHLDDITDNLHQNLSAEVGLLRSQIKELQTIVADLKGLIEKQSKEEEQEIGPAPEGQKAKRIRASKKASAENSLTFELPPQEKSD